MSTLTNAHQKRKVEDILNFLTPLKIFCQLDAAAIRAIAAELTGRHLSEGETLFQQGDLGDAFYILTSGALQASMYSTAETGVFVKNLNVGECVGEMSLLTGQPRTATVTALKDSELLCLTRTAFEHLVEEYPALLTGSSVSGKYNFGDSLSGWQALAGSMSPFAKVKAPHLFSIVAGLVEGICHYRLNEVWRSADLLIQVPVQPYGLLDFDKYAEIIETGYRAAQEQLKGLN